ncbi:NAD-dependent epimerase/dehydratase family protein [Enterovibrio norvegicus]|uniref:NAD-dependent epimerase/dehydratase family protein n=1 Tax=Enterovibrio norvegicus TaxID=188144 RepID=UPI003D123022
MKILVTGSTGFVARQFILLAESKGDVCFKHARNVSVDKSVFSADLSLQVDWSSVLKGVDCVVHCAALVHQSKNGNSLDYSQVNTLGTLALAEQAALAGVGRFVFLSSIKVNGECTALDIPFREAAIGPPNDPYGKSKYVAEVELQKLASKTGMEVVIIRPPLVYGPGVRANFQSMMKWVQKGIPLPLKNTDNKRSLIYLENLTDFIRLCTHHPSAANQTFLVSDQHDVSTSELLTSLSSSMGKRSRLFPFPKSLLKFACRLTGKVAITDRIFGNLQLDTSKAQELLDWIPPYTVREGIQKTVEDFLMKGSKKL